MMVSNYKVAVGEQRTARIAEKLVNNQQINEGYT